MSGSYPADCESVPGDEVEYCPVCGMADDCCCPVCPVCGEQGNKKCYGYVNPIVYDKLMRVREQYMIASEEMTAEPDSLIRVEKLYQEMQALEEQIGGHGLEITAEQIASVMKAEDEMDNDYYECRNEADRRDEEDVLAQQESMDEYYLEMAEHGRQLMETI